MHPATRNQPKWALSGNVVSKVNLYVVVTRNALVRPASEGIEILSVKLADDIGDIRAVIVDRAGDAAGIFDSGDLQLRWRNNEALVHKDIRASGMIDGHQRQGIVVIGFPKLGGDAQVVEAVAWHEFVVIDLVPLLSRFDACRAEGVDAQPDGGTPGHRVFHEFHLLAIEGEEEGTRTLQALLGHNLLVGLHSKFSPHSAIWPDDADNISGGLISQTEVHDWSGDRLFLYEHARADFHLATDAERIDPLVTDSLLRVGPDHRPVIVLLSVIDCLQSVLI